MRVLKNFIVELVVYSAMVALYVMLVLQFLNEPLSHLFGNDSTLYAVVALGLVIGQGVLLEELTSLLLNWLHLTRFE